MTDTDFRVQQTYGEIRQTVFEAAESVLTDGDGCDLTLARRLAYLIADRACQQLDAA